MLEAYGQWQRWLEPDLQTVVCWRSVSSSTWPGAVVKPESGEAKGGGGHGDHESTKKCSIAVPEENEQFFINWGYI